MKTTETGIIYTIDIFNKTHYTEEEQKYSKQSKFRLKLAILANDFIEKNNPAAQDLILEDSSKDENVEVFVQLFFQEIMNGMYEYSENISKVSILEKAAFKQYLNFLYTPEQIATIEIDNTKELSLIKNVGFSIVENLFSVKDSNFFSNYFSVKYPDRSWASRAVEFQTFSIEKSDDRIVGENVKYKTMYCVGNLRIDKKKKAYKICVSKKNNDKYEFKMNVSGFNVRFLIILTINMITKNAVITIRKGRGEIEKNYQYFSEELLNSSDFFLKSSIYQTIENNTKKVTNLSNIF